MSVILVNTTAGLEAALAHEAGGDTISLAPGSYSGVVINNVNRTTPVMITSQLSKNPAAITDLIVQNSSNVSIQHIVMDATNDVPTDKTSQFTNMAVVRNSSKISFVNDQFHGAPDVTLNNSIEALLIENSPSVTVTQSSFQNFHDGINLFNSDHFSGTLNSFYRIYDDGYRGGGDNAVSIQHNTFNTFHMDPTDIDHPDTIQFWTTNTTKSANGFNIIGNNFTRGVNGNAVQGIFFRDQVGDLPFLNVNITGNVYAGTLWTGIRVTGGKSVTVTGNTMTSYSDFTSRIELDSVSTGSVSYNHAGAYIYTGDTGLSVLGNVVDQAVPTPTQATGFAQAHIGFAGAAAEDWALSAPAIITPEPATWLVMMFGLAIVGGVLRRRQAAGSASSGTVGSFGLGGTVRSVPLPQS